MFQGGVVGRGVADLLVFTLHLKCIVPVALLLALYVGSVTIPNCNIILLCHVRGMGALNKKAMLVSERLLVDAIRRLLFVIAQEPFNLLLRGRVAVYGAKRVHHIFAVLVQHL